MSSTVQVKGVNYTLAADGDKDYGAYMTTLINAMITAYNDTPVQTNVAQYDAVVSSVAARRTHATLEAVIADAGVVAGSNVLIDGDVFTQNTTLNISKKLYIYGLGDSGFEAGAGLGANPIIRFSVSGSRFQGISLDANGNTPTYGIQVDAALFDIALDVEMIGAFATGFIDNQATDEALVGFIKTLTGNYLLPISTPGANAELSNLTSPTAVNEDIVGDTDNTYDFGSAAINWVIGHFKGIESSTSLGITGGVDVDVEASTGAITATGATTADVVATAGDATISAGTDVVLNPASDLAYVDISGNEQLIVWSDVVQDYTVTGSVGTAGQQQAYHIITYTDLDSELSNFSTLACYSFVDGANLTVDDVGAYTLTNNNAATAANGIFGSGYATALDGVNQYYDNATLLDTIAGLSDGYCIIIDFKADDGQPAAIQYLIDKLTIAGNDYTRVGIDTNGDIFWITNQNGVGNISDRFSLKLVDNANGWHRIILNHDSTNGKRGWLDGQLCLENSEETILPRDDAGASTSFAIGDLAATGNSFDGTIGQVIVGNAILTQRDVDFICSTTIAEPTILNGEEYVLYEKVQPKGDVDFEYQRLCNVVTKYNNLIYRLPFSAGSTDKVKIIART